MASSIPPSSPHGFSSQINPSDLHLTSEQKENLKQLLDKLKELKQEAGYASHNLHSIAGAIEGLDPLHNSFLTSVNKDGNRGHVTNIKDKFESLHHQFLEDLGEIKDPEEKESLHDVAHDHKKLSSFLESANNASFEKLSEAADTYIRGLQSAFHTM